MWFFFFFQAEDGIRDATVTGVQTCALPIWPRDGSGELHLLPGTQRTQDDAARCFTRRAWPTALLLLQPLRVRRYRRSPRGSPARGGEHRRLRDIRWTLARHARR